MRVKYHDRLPGKYADWYCREVRRWFRSRVENAGSQLLLGCSVVTIFFRQPAVAEYGGNGDSQGNLR
jgi:hypothetical protein